MRWGSLAALVIGCAHAPPGPEEGPVVESVSIEGARAVRAEEIARGLATQEGQRLDPVALESDRRRVETYYKLRGYYQVRVVTIEARPAGEDQVSVAIDVDEGPPTRIAQMDTSGLDTLPAGVRQRVLATLPLAPGAVLEASAYQEAQELLETRLMQSGYADAEVLGRVDVYPERSEALVHFSASPGLPHHYGALVLQGLRTLPGEPLLAIARRELPQGGLYDPRALEAAEARLYGLGAFDRVRVALAYSATDGSTEAEVLIVVDEAPAHALSAGGGLGVEQSLQQIELLAEYKNLGFLGGLRRLVWHNDLALRFLPSFLDPERTGLGAETFLELTQSEVAPRADAAARLGFERVFRQGFQSNALTGRLGLPYHLGPRTLLVPSLNYQRYFGVVGREPLGPRAPPLSATCPSPCTLTFAELRFSLDHRDDPLSARAGFLLDLDTQYALGLLGGGFHDVLIAPEARVYLPAAERLVVAARARLGALFTLGDTDVSPIVQRFFGGGEGGHRGFGAEQLAPLIQDTGGEFVPIGGDGLWLATIEARLRLTQRWGAVAFADYGDVTLEPLDLDLGAGHLALGLGARFYTVAGPVRLDVAYRVDRRVRRAFDTSVVADRGGLDFFALFLSLGEAF